MWFIRYSRRSFTTTPPYSNNLCRVEMRNPAYNTCGTFTRPFHCGHRLRVNVTPFNSPSEEGVLLDLPPPWRGTVSEAISGGRIFVGRIPLLNPALFVVLFHCRIEPRNPAYGNAAALLAEWWNAHHSALRGVPAGATRATTKGGKCRVEPRNPAYGYAIAPRSYGRQEQRGGR